MDGTWRIVKWTFAAVMVAYVVVQLVAARRLKTPQKKRSNSVAMEMLMLMGLSGAIRDIFFFENRMAYRVGDLIIGFAALAAIVVLVRMFSENPVAIAESQGRGAWDSRDSVDLRADS